MRRRTADGSVTAAPAGSSRRPTCRGRAWRRSPARCRPRREVAARRAGAGRPGSGDRCRVGFARVGRAERGGWRSCRRVGAVGLWAGGVGSSGAEPGRAAAGCGRGCLFLGSFWTAALYLHRGPLVHALLVFPGARLRRPLGRLVVAAAYLDGAIEPLGASPIVTLGLCAAIAIAAIDGYLREIGPRRRARLVATAGAAALALALGFSAVGRLADWDIEAGTLWTFEA